MQTYYFSEVDTNQYPQYNMFNDIENSLFEILNSWINSVPSFSFFFGIDFSDKNSSIAVWHPMDKQGILLILIPLQHES